MKWLAVQATIMTDPGTADRTYVGPMTPEMVEEIIQLVHFLVSEHGWFLLVSRISCVPVSRFLARPAPVACMHSLFTGH